MDFDHVGSFDHAQQLRPVIQFRRLALLRAVDEYG